VQQVGRCGISNAEQLTQNSVPYLPLLQADGLAQTGDFVKVPISCLQWEYRLPMILQEIRAANADIICLQELNHFGEQPLTAAGGWHAHQMWQRIISSS